jgi:hypothetical protein
MEKISWKVVSGLICVTIILYGLLIHSFLNSLSPTNRTYPSTNQSTNQNPQQIINRTFSFKAAIIDQLSISDPDPFFIKAATYILEMANFTVKYYPREQVMIELYKDLATYDYGLIIFRVHSGREPVTFFFSGEPYNTTEYFPEQWNDQIGQCQVPDETLTHFSIRPLFVKYAMKGSFYKTVIIAMGCASLRTTEMAQAFIEKGAAAYIGWNASLTAFYGDLATLSVIKHLLLENQTVEEAVDAAMIEVGPCPTNKSGTTSILSVYPSSSQNYTIPYVADDSQTP